MLVAGIEVNRDPVRQFLAGAGHGFLQKAFGFVKLALLQGAESGLIVLHSLCKTRIFVHRFLGSSFLRHP